MKNLGLWKINNGQPQRLVTGQISLEKDLEDWIEKDPSLLSQDIIIIGRQIILDSGRLALLAIDVVGRLIVIEIKRGRLTRDTVSQALDYAACINDMSASELSENIVPYLNIHNPKAVEIVNQLLENTVSGEREVMIYIVGTDEDKNLDRIMRYVNAQIIAVTFKVFVNNSNYSILVRELTELQAENVALTPSADRSNYEKLLALATENGVGAAFQILHEVATSLGLSPRYYRRSIMYTPPNKRNRMLFTTWIRRRQGGMESYIGIEPFAEFYAVSETQVSGCLGKEGYRYLSDSDARDLANRLLKLFELIDEQTLDD